MATTDSQHELVQQLQACSLPRVGDYVGHSSTYMTDRYRHLIAGQREDDAARLDTLLGRAIPSV
jgi:hypothetical protein